MSERILLTPAGEAKLRAELKQLKSKDRPKVIADIAEARAHGDLSENAEYHAARELQGFIEGRIKELESKLSHAQVIDPTKTGVEGKVVFGAHVVLYDLESEEEVTYQIVGDLEADLDHGRISVSSPLARALLGKRIENSVRVRLPGGDVEYFILKIAY